jgi:hypothetical protein
MYAVIFKAKIKTLDPNYSTLAAQLRERALTQFNCQNFIAVTEGEWEIAISYWRSLDDIQRWKEDPLHQSAQQQGKDCWYSGYQVEIVEILRRYDHSSIP